MKETGITLSSVPLPTPDSLTMRLSRILFSGHGDDANIDPELIKGWRKYYNSYTAQGRFNVSASTLSAVALVGLYFMLRPKKKAVENKK